MSWDFVAGAVYGCVQWTLMDLLCSHVKRRKAKAAAAQPDASQPAAPAAPDQRAPSAHWFPLPGNRVLELGLSGYSIELLALPGVCTYRLLDPEGDTVICHGSLPVLKAYAEHLAACREEFVYRPNRGEGATS